MDVVHWDLCVQQHCSGNGLLADRAPRVRLTKTYPALEHGTFIWGSFPLFIQSGRIKEQSSRGFNSNEEEPVRPWQDPAMDRERVCCGYAGWRKQG